MRLNITSCASSIVVFIYDEFLNSLSVEENIPKTYKLLRHSKLLYKKSHSHRQLGNSLYIIAESTEIKM